MLKDSRPAPPVLDFDDGVDAIEFLIESFGFEDLDALRGAGDLEDSNGAQSGEQIRLVISNDAAD